MVALLKSALMIEGTGSAPEDETVARRAAGQASSSAPAPDPEVAPIARRRRFSGSEKRRLLAEADRCKESGQLGAFLRRERIYSSMLASWRKQVGKAELVALAPKKRGPKPDPSARQIQQLNRDNARLRHELERAKLIIDAQKKLCVALGLPTADETSENE
jgi:transposase